MSENSLRIIQHIAAGDLQRAASALFSLPTLDSSAYAAVLHCCAKRCLLPLGRSIHRHLLLSSHSIPLFLSNHVINMYSKCGRTDLARHLFDEMPHRNLVSWTALLTGYSRMGQHPLCFHLFSSMLVHYTPNDYGIVSVLSSCAHARDDCHGKQVHALVFKISLDSNPFVGNSLITMYSSCNNRLEEDALLVFNTMPFRNLITWNSMIAGLLQCGRSRQSLELFVRMRRRSAEFDRATLLSAISSCSSLPECRQLHSLCIKSHFASEAEVATAVVKVYSSLGGDIRYCYEVFLAAAEHDIVSWTGIITAFCEKEPAGAHSMFCRLFREGFKPDQHAFSIAVKACSGFSTERHCMALHALVLKSGYLNGTVLCNALIHAYARCGGIELAIGIFDQMSFRDVVSWNSIIKAHAAHGKGEDALSAFRRMKFSPDSATFVGVLTACSHCGYVNEGRRIFTEMAEVYKIEPQKDHFACMVDILGRAGKLLEAEKLIGRMPMAPDAVVWSALLGACRKHGETDIGKRAAQKLMELEPRNSVGYVMISSIYCASKCFDVAAFVRKGMRECGIKKEPGLSWIEIRGLVHEFSVGGHRHPCREEILLWLRMLVVKLKEMGYVADVRSVLYEIDEELKEEHLLLHSEKMALAFGLMNSSSNLTSLKIMKNLRICEDCHNFFKFASKYTGREIVVRDANRFHHFADGACSCVDYW